MQVLTAKNFCRHSGRVLQLVKCDKSGSTLGSSTSTRPLVPQKRSTQQADSQPAKRVASQNGTKALQASTSNEAASSSTAIKQLQSTVDDVLARLAALPAPQPSGLTEDQVIDLIDARLAQQRQQFQQSLQELQDLCETGFVNIQASFDAVGEWKEEVTQTFTKIQEWATAIEEKIIVQPENTSQANSTHRLSHPGHLSSTPSSLPPSTWQTPAAPPIKHASGIRRSFRLSEAPDFTLATIPEQPNTPSHGEEQETRADIREDEELPLASGVHVKNTPLDQPEKHVRISLPVEDESVAGTSAEEVSAAVPSAAADALADLVDAHEPSQNLIAFTPKHATRTPMASRTLFGTEKSTEERFDDIVDVLDGNATADSLQPATPGWTVSSPSRLLRDSTSVPLL